MDATVNKNYMKGFIPFAMAAALVSLAGGFTAYGLKVRRTAKAEDSVEDTIAKPDNGSEE